MKTKSTFARLTGVAAVLIAFLSFSIPASVWGQDECPSDLLLLLHLDENAGPNYADYYGVHNGVASVSPTAITGKINGAQLFDDNSKINIADDRSAFEWSTNASFSFECWFKTTLVDAQVALGRNTDISANNVSWWIGLNGNGYATLELRDASSNNSVLSANTNLADNQWHHLVAVRNGATNHNTLYVDGVQVADGTWDLPDDFACTSPQDVTVGYLHRANESSPQYHWNGSLDEIAIYNRALTSGEISSFYNAGSPLPHCGSGTYIPPPVSYDCPSGLLALYTLDETTGPTYADFKDAHNAESVGTSPTASTGIINGAQLLNENTKILIPDNGNDFDWTGDASFTLEFWFKSATQGEAQVAISRYEVGTDMTWWLAINEDGHPLMEVQDDVDSDPTAVYGGSTNYCDNQWHFVTGVRDAAGKKISVYVDGTLIAQKTDIVYGGNFIASSPVDITIGYMKRAPGAPEYHMKGLMDEVAIYTRALSLSEIQAEYHSGAPSCHCTTVADTLAVLSQPVTTATEDVPYSYTFTVTGKNPDDVLVLSAVTKPAWLTFNWTPGAKTAVLSGTPGNANVGANHVVLNVTDGLGTIDQDFTINVASVNDLPVITAQVPLSVNEDSPITLTKANFTISDPDNPASDISIEVLPGTGYTYTGNTVTPALNFNGLLTVNVAAHDLVDQGVTYEAKITVNPVHDDPVIVSNPLLQVQPLETYTYDMIVEDPDEGETLTLSAVSIPAWLSFNWVPGENSARLTGIPAVTDLGVANITLRVNDGTVNVDKIFSINVTEVNDPPVITGQYAINVDEDHSVTILKSDLIITDVDNPLSDITIHVLPGQDYTLNGNTITPAANFNGSLSVNVYAMDLESQGEIHAVEITVNPVNDLPVFGSNPPLTVSANHAYTYHLTVSDPDLSDNLTLSAETKPAWLTFQWIQGQKSATLSGTPSVANAGTNHVILRVNDGHISVNQEFDIEVSTVENSIPVISGQNELSMNEDGHFTLSKSDLLITDTDNPISDLTLEVLPGDDYSYEGNIIQPDANFNGTLHVNVVAKDLYDQSEPYSVVITVNAVNDLPVLVNQPPLSVDAGQLYNWPILVTDADNDVITITSIIKPAWLSLTTGSHSVIAYGMPTAADVGSHSFAISISDGHAQVLKTFTIVVNAASGIDDLGGDHANLVYPNPATDKVYFKFEMADDSRIEVFDMNGNLVKGVNTGFSDQAEMDISDLPAGIYFYKTNHGTQSKTGKFIKQ